MRHTHATMLLLPAVTSFTHAQSAGQWIVSADWMHLASQDSSQLLTVHAFGQSAEVSGNGPTLASANTFALTTQYLIANHVALETMLDVPPKLHPSGTGSLIPVGELGTARARSPAAQVQYHFGEPNVHVRPYLSVGFGYVWYRDAELNRLLATGQILASPTMGSMLVGPTTASLSKSFTPIVNTSLTYNLDAYWPIGVSVSYMWLSTKATLTTQAPVGTVITTVKVQISPLVGFLSVGYRFWQLRACLGANRAVAQLGDGDGAAWCTGLLGRGTCRRGGLFRRRHVLLCDSFSLAHRNVDLLDAGALFGGGRRSLSRQLPRRSLHSPW